MQFSLGARENDLAVKVEYLDPSQVDPRLGGSQVLPVSFEVRNISSQPVTFNARDVRLNLGGTVPLDPVTPDAAAREIKRMNRVPAFLSGSRWAVNRVSTVSNRSPPPGATL